MHPYYPFNPFNICKLGKDCASMIFSLSINHAQPCLHSSSFARGQALLELMPGRFKSGFNLAIKIRPDPSSAFKRFSPHCPSLIRRDGGGGNGVQNLKGAMTFPYILVINLPIKMEENLFI
jgi:hypothetical protein